MALDGGLIVGYLTAAALGAGKRWVDRTVDTLLDQLTAGYGSGGERLRDLRLHAVHGHA